MGRFLIVASYPDSVVRFRGDLIRALVSSGMEVHVAAPGMKKARPILAASLGTKVKLHNVSMSRTGTNPVVDFFSLLSLLILMVRVRPEFVLAYTVKPVVYGLLAARFANVKNKYALITGLGYAFQGHSGELHGFGVQSIVRWLYSRSLSYASKVFFQNPDDEALFRGLKLISDDIPSFVLNGSGVSVDYYKFSTVPTSASFTLIARLMGDKGVREYVSAARRIKGTYPSACFNIVGWIDENPDSIGHDELEMWVSEGVINYLGKMSDVRPAIDNSLVYVLPSYREGTPRTVLEAMAMGRAVITTDAPGCRETVIDGENGFLVPVKSVDALVEAMTRFIEDPELATRMGKRSREIAVEKYDVHKVNAVMLKEMGIQ